jgi:hypothetical protein
MNEQQVLNVLNDVLKKYKDLSRLNGVVGLQYDQIILQEMYSKLGENYSSLFMMLEHRLQNEAMSEMLTLEELGVRMWPSRTPEYLNKRLVEIGLQYWSGDNYQPTKRAEGWYYGWTDLEYNYKLKWSERLIDILKL